MRIVLETFSSYFSIYMCIKYYFQETKARVYISLLNSIILSLYSIYSFWNWRVHSIYYFLESDPNYALTNYALGYFTVDMFLGHFYDRKNMNLITGYVHHSVFIGLICFINLTHQPNIIYLFVPFEIPTMLLDISRLNNHHIINNLFGVNFFIFRILYNLHIISTLWQYQKIYSIFTTLLLCMHLYWFKQWFIKQRASLHS